MRLRRLHIGLPLLSKELLEQALRRRTYIVRVLYASLLLGGVYFIAHDTLSQQTYDLFSVLGHGRRIFENLVMLQFYGIYLFMPAMTSGVLTLEKERNSLGLLLLTRLGPWAILFEKLLGRLIPMFSYLLLSLPLLAFAYALGGITEELLWGAILLLALSALQVGTLAVFCSAYFRTTAGALIAAYILGSLLFFTLPALEELDLILNNNSSIFAVLAIEYWGLASRFESLPWMFCGMGVFFDNQGAFAWTYSIPILFSSVVYFCLARICLIHRAFAPPRNPLLKVFRWLDGFFWGLNERYTRGIVLVPEVSTLPEEDPVAWRETTKKSLGTLRYLVRILLAIEGPTVFVCIVIAINGAYRGLQGASILVFILWLIAGLMISIKATSLIAGERSQQTLDVLLVTPLSGREIVRQKFRGVWRLTAMLLVPFLTVFFFETWWKNQFSDIAYGFSGRHRQFDAPVYLTCSLLSLAIYLPLIAWLSFGVGLRVRSQTRAILASLGILIGWCVIPLIVVISIAQIFGLHENAFSRLATLLSPAAIIPVNEWGELEVFFLGNSNDFRKEPEMLTIARWIPVLTNFLLYGLILMGIRRVCLNSADKYLGRSEVAD